MADNFLPSPSNYRPSGYFWRKAIREAQTQEQLREIALVLLDELEDHRAAFRELGMWPPRKHDAEEVTRQILHPDSTQEG
jgi:hypothetical protein